MLATPTTIDSPLKRRLAKAAAITGLLIAVGCGGGGDVTGTGGGGGGGLTPVASVSLDQTSATIVVGGAITLTATPHDAGGNALSGRTIGWTTSNASAASVSSTGVVTGIANGTTTITATSEGKSAAATITVTAVQVASITLSASTASVVAGQKTSFTAITKDASGNVLTGRTLTWASSAPTVATVDASGSVTGVAPGTATITATSGTASASATVTVTPVPVATVAVTPASDTLASFGDTVTYHATVKDASGNTLTGRTVTWTTSNDTVATVSSSGLVTAVHAGTDTITATSEGQKGTATVVVPSVSKIVITPATPSIPVGGTVTLTIMLEDSQGRQLGGRAGQKFISDQSIISVNGNVITGLSRGTATVTYTVEGATAVATITVTP